MTYSHRNGETEPPEVEGVYWWRSMLSGRHVIISVFRDHYGHWVAMSPEEEGTEYLQNIVEGKWFGPIPEPEVTE